MKHNRQDNFPFVLNAGDIKSSPPTGLLVTVVFRTLLKLNFKTSYMLQMPSLAQKMSIYLTPSLPYFNDA